VTSGSAIATITTVSTTASHGTILAIPAPDISIVHESGVSSNLIARSAIATVATCLPGRSVCSLVAIRAMGPGLSVLSPAAIRSTRAVSTIGTTSSIFSEGSVAPGNADATISTGTTGIARAPGTPIGSSAANRTGSSCITVGSCGSVAANTAIRAVASGSADGAGCSIAAGRTIDSSQARRPNAVRTVHSVHTRLAIQTLALRSQRQTILPIGTRRTGRSVCADRTCGSIPPLGSCHSRGASESIFSIGPILGALDQNASSPRSPILTTVPILPVYSGHAVLACHTLCSCLPGLGASAESS